MEGAEVGEAVEGLVADSLDAGGVEEEAGDALAADEGLVVNSIEFQQTVQRDFQQGV